MKRKTLAEYLEDRGMIVDKMGKMLNDAALEGRDLTPEEIKKYTDLETKQAALSKQAELMKSHVHLEDELDKPFETGVHRRSLNDNDGRIDQEPKQIIPANEIFSAARRTSQPEPGVTLGGILRAMAGAGSTPAIQNALSIGTDSAGGYTVPTELMAQLIDTLRAKSVCNAAGCQTVVLDTKQTNVARMDTDPVASWRAEAAAVAESDPTFSNVQFDAKSLAVLVKVSYELLQDSINIEAALMNAFAQSLALTLDQAALSGAGTSNQPRGIINTVGIKSVDLGTDGAALTGYNPLIDANYELANANAANPTAAVMAPRTSTTFAKLVDSTNQPLQRPSMSQIQLISA
ncbi:MAG: phage major capsid protein [Candidatus Thiodiazotropha sp. (ex Troendleina suluensis)]|nr:phage major capsid protein [Candidatus Thiodiazotropha sp. (ex Troendleina suluensis)]